MLIRTGQIYNLFSSYSPTQSPWWLTVFTPPPNSEQIIINTWQTERRSVSYFAQKTQKGSENAYSTHGVA